MFRSEYIDLAIGLAVVFFLTSLIVSGLNEGLQWTFRVRSKFLWSYLFDLADPKRTKTLPRGLLGIAHLWNKKNDKRPEVREHEDGAVVAGGAVEPNKMIKRVANALDPLDVPDVAGKEGQKKTTIQNVPAGSLAQAFLEVFADIGKERIADDLLMLGEDYGTATDKAALLRPMVARPGARRRRDDARSGAGATTRRAGSRRAGGRFAGGHAGGPPGVLGRGHQSECGGGRRRRCTGERRARPYPACPSRRA